MINELCKVGTFIFSLGSLPLLFTLSFSVYRDIKKNDGIDRSVAYILFALFSILFVTSILSMIISFADMNAVRFGLGTADITPISRARSFFFSCSNFLTSFAFYKIYRQGAKE